MNLRRLAWIVGGVAVLTLSLVGAAFADNGPHGGYTATTDACAGCHRAHTAKGASLLTTATTEADKSGFCYSCHSGGTGAYTDVKSGMLIVTATVNTALEDTVVPAQNVPLKGGGFEWVRMNVALTGTLDLSTTSRHMVTGGSNVVWGYGVTETTANAGPTGVALTCTNCHNPHGKAGLGSTATYRLLKGGATGNTPLFANGSVTMSASVNIPDSASAREYGIDLANSFNNPTRYPGSYFGEHSNYGVAGDGTINAYGPMTQWCAQCHTRYMAQVSAGPGHTSSGDGIYSYRHPTNYNSSNGCDNCHNGDFTFQLRVPGCLVCHVAHGTGARTSSYSGSVSWPDPNHTQADNRSSLLRLDNRGVCQSCHKK